MKDISKDVVLTLFLIICSRFILVLSFKHIFNHYRNNPQELSKPYLHESQVRVIQSKMDELETQFKALLSLTKKMQLLLEDSLYFYQLIQVLDLS